MQLLYQPTLFSRADTSLVKISLTNFNCISLKHTLHQCAFQTLDHVIITQQTAKEEMSNCEVHFENTRV